MFPLPAARIHEEGLPQEVDIPGFWDFLVPIISRTCTGAICSSLPQYGSEEPVSVPRCYIGRPEGPGNGSRSRTSLQEIHSLPTENSVGDINNSVGN